MNAARTTNPKDHPEWPAFYKYVTTNLGDIPVLDEGNFISRKIHGYWILWLYCKDVNQFVGKSFAVFTILVERLLGEPPETHRDPISQARIDRYHQMWRYFGGT